MSIEAFNPHTSIEVEPYTIISNEVIRNIDNMEAGFIWVYLRTKPREWIVVKQHLQNHFKIGASKIRTLMGYLSKNNLISYRRERSTNGRIVCAEIVVLNGSLFLESLKNPLCDAASTTGLKSGIVDENIHRVKNPASGESTTSKKYIININNKKRLVGKRKKKKPETPLPEDWKPNDKHYDLAQSLNLDIQTEYNCFSDHALSKDRKLFNWDAGFRNWLRQAAKYVRFAPSNKFYSATNVTNVENQSTSYKGFGPIEVKPMPEHLRKLMNITRNSQEVGNNNAK